MKRLACALLLTGCATTLRDARTGKAIVTIQSNAARVHYVNSIAGITLDVDGLNNSVPTAAALRGASHLVTDAASAAAPFAPGAGAATTLAPAAGSVLRTLWPTQ